MLLRDLRYALRILIKSPGFGAAAALTLALGLGANAAAFSVIDALLLHPYSVGDLDRLHLVRATDSGSSTGESKLVTAGDYLDLSRQTRFFEVLAAARFAEFNLSGSIQPELAEGYFVSPELFGMLAAHALKGRTFRPEEAKPGRDGIVLLGERLWRARFAADPTIVGRDVRVNGRSCVIVGVMPKEFHYPLGAQLWLPLAFGEAEKTDRGFRSLLVLGRLRLGVKPHQAGNELASFGAGLARLFPNTNARRGFTLLPLRREQYIYSLPLFALVQIAAVFVLVLASVNVGGILIARAMARETEIAIRTALGASRLDLFLVTFAEVLVLAGLGAGLGVVAAAWAVDAIQSGMPPDIAIWLAGWDQVSLTSRALVVSAILTFVTSGVLASLIALRKSSRSVEVSLREATAIRGGSHRRHRALQLLVISQVVLATLLLASAALLVASFRRIEAAFEAHAPANLLAFDIHLPPAQYPGALRQAAFFRRTLAVLAALPGVEAAVAVQYPPASNVDNPMTRFETETHPGVHESDLPSAGLQVVSPGFLRAFHVPLLRGRDFNESDGAEALPVALIGSNLARREFPRGDAIGRRIRLRSKGVPETWITIVGIVGDVRQNWFDVAPPPIVYLPVEQAPVASLTVALRTAGDPPALTAAVRRAVGRLDPDLPLGAFGAFKTRIVESLAPVRIIGLLLAVFGTAALALAMVGVFGVTAQSVARRRHELGVRLALGAPRWGVLVGVVKQAVLLTLLGVGLALPLMHVSAKLLESRVFGLIADDKVTLALVSLTLLVVGACAALLPARRATRVDPAEALRSG